jgi:uncharacterized protein YoxC
MTITEILTGLLLISASALCIALIYYIQKIVQSVQSINDNIKELSSEFKPLIKSTLELSDKLNQITNDTRSQLNVAKSIISDFRDRADRILNLESKIRGGFEDAIMPLINNLHAVGKGVETFWRNFRNK